MTYNSILSDLHADKTCVSSKLSNFAGKGWLIDHFWHFLTHHATPSCDALLPCFAAPRCAFQKTEAQNGAKITRVVCATDCKAVGWLLFLIEMCCVWVFSAFSVDHRWQDPIYPGPLCREFLTSTCAWSAKLWAIQGLTWWKEPGPEATQKLVQRIGKLTSYHPVFLLSYFPSTIMVPQLVGVTKTAVKGNKGHILIYKANRQLLVRVHGWNQDIS